MHSIRSWFSKSSGAALLLLGILVGIGGALGAALFHSLIYLSTLAFYGHSGDSSFLDIVNNMSAWQRILIPTLGGLLGGIIYKVAKVNEAEGEGVPEVMEALAHKQGTIRPIVAPVKIITAALTLGSGGSAGREGPVIQIGSAIGSSIAQFFKQATPERSLLLAAGAAAGIGGTFGAPMAGVLFTVEILHHRPGLLRATVLIVAAFLSAFLTRLMTGHEGLRFAFGELPAFDTPLILSIIGLSVISAIVALLFGSTLTFGRFLFKKATIPHIIKPALGGFAIGCIGLFIPYIHEPAAYPLMIDLLTLTTLPLTFILSLLIVKMLATSITLGSGGSGGIFAPLLLLGALTGSILGTSLVAMSLTTPAIIVPLVIIGMATMFAAASHAPLTAAFITYEMTEAPELLVPLIISCLIATQVSKQMRRESVYEHSTLPV